MRLSYPLTANQVMINTPNLDGLKAATTRGDLANLLDVKLVFLTNVLYRIGVDNQYSDFSIPKKSGGDRIISAPSRKLKDLQGKLAKLLINCRQEIFLLNGVENKISHGFEKDRTIITNALKHSGKRVILNIDLSNFFQSVNFGRVRGFLISNNNFKLHPDIATTIAHAACYKGTLPQGSPCSPVITNFICSILDIRLAALAKKLGCTYSRYADDITFSTNKTAMPEQLVVNDESGVILGRALRGEIERANFEINDSKTRLTFRPSRHEVTGLTVNRFVNVDRRYSKKVRALAHSLYQTGSFTTKDSTGKDVVGTLQQLEGMFGFIDQIDKFNNIVNKQAKVKEKYAPVKQTLLEHRSKLNAREKAYAKFIYFKYFHGSSTPTIMTEGKTDRVYIKSALLRLADRYPQFITTNENTKKKQVKLNFVNPKFKEKYFLDIDEGAATFDKFARRYDFEFKSFYGTKAASPVVIILDNDTGPKELLNYIANDIPTCPKTVEDIRKMPFIHVMHNLYIILTPLSDTGGMTAMEDLFDAKTLEQDVGGRKFNRGKKINPKTDLNKDEFSLKVVRDMAKDINFDGFFPVFDALNEVSNHYEKILKAP